MDFDYSDFSALIQSNVVFDLPSMTHWKAIDILIPELLCSTAQSTTMQCIFSNTFLVFRPDMFRFCTSVLIELPLIFHSLDPGDSVTRS